MDGCVLAVLQSGDVKNNDITSGSMSTPPNVEKSRLSQRKCKALI